MTAQFPGKTLYGLYAAIYFYSNAKHVGFMRFYVTAKSDCNKVFFSARAKCLSKRNTLHNGTPASRRVKREMCVDA